MTLNSFEIVFKWLSSGFNTDLKRLEMAVKQGEIKYKIQQVTILGMHSKSCVIFLDFQLAIKEAFKINT